MLLFWMLSSDVVIEFEDDAIKDPPDRQPDFSISLSFLELLKLMKPDKFTIRAHNEVCSCTKC